MSASSKSTRLSPVAQKGALIVLVGSLVLLCLALLPYLWLGQFRAEAQGQRDAYELIAGRAASAASRSPRLTMADKPENMFLPGTTEGTTLAAFQGLVGEVAARSNMSVLRMQPLPADETEGLTPYRLAVDLSGTLEQLRTMLADVESSLPIIIVTGFEIRPRAAGGAEADPFPSEDLMVSLRLESFAVTEAP